MSIRTEFYNQKTIGILGGMSNHATGEYYRLLNDQLAEANNGNTGEIAIVSVNYGNIEHFVFNDLWSEAEAYLAEKLDRLEAARPDVVLCASNSMHLAFEPVISKRQTPYIHIVDPTGHAIREAGISRIGFLGTRFTMNSTKMHRRYLERWGVEIIVPDEQDRDLIDHITLQELCHGIVSPESKSEALDVVADLEERGAQGIILGCTELCLLLRPEDVPHLPAFDTTALHIAAAVDFVRGDDSLVSIGSRLRLAVGG
ncbi:aspartate/glutamate racemase family protein [Youhaiella tibetensis]|nr:amino acid racemase [Youhaiella tibetensis]